MEHKMKLISALLISVAFLFTGCASVDMATKEESTKAKQFNAPNKGNSGLYVYRDSFVGKALKKDIWVDNTCLGRSGPDVFFYTEVTGGKKHIISTESEFSLNKVELMFDSDKNYFIRQYIKMGLLSFITAICCISTALLSR